MPDKLLAKVQATIKRHGLLDGCRHVLLAVSGGADSVALARLFSAFRRPGLRVTVAHLHHGIRGREADEDARFVRRLARQLKFPLIVERADVPDLARRKTVSLEMAAREARYVFFQRAARAAGADRVATAHTGDDQVETVLLKLFRGSGPGALSGMPYRRRAGNLHIIRPLLDTTRREVEAYLSALKQSWREDSSNRDTAILRNRVRRELLPWLEHQVNPGVRGALRQTAEILRDEEAWLDTLGRALLAGCLATPGGSQLHVRVLSRLNPAAQRRVLRIWLADSGLDISRIGFPAVERLRDLLRKPGGSKGVPLDGGRRAARVYDTLRLTIEEPAKIAPWKRALRVPGSCRLRKQGLVVRVRLAQGLRKQTRLRLLHFPAEATLNARRQGTARLYVRNWRPGDRIAPLGMSGSKKLQDLFVDRKLPSAERDRVPLLECRGEIVWVPGYAVARGWQVTNPADRNLQVTIEREELR